jgi:RNA polymerase sigma-70 factor (ECF subfamily)
MDRRRHPGGRGHEEVAAGVLRDTGALGRILAGRHADLPADVFVDPVNVALPMAAAVDLVDAALRGDPSGWDGLFDRFYPVVHRYALARTGDRTAAEEVAQEVLVAAVGTLSRLRERSEAGIEGWFLGIARFKLVDRARRRAREDHLRVVVEPDEDAADLASSLLTAAELRRALEELTEEQRDVVVRRFVLDQSLEQVAAATGRRVGAVKAMQHRALAALSRRLGSAEAWR